MHCNSLTIQADRIDLPTRPPETDPKQQSANSSVLNMTQEIGWKCFGIGMAAVIAICVIVVVTALVVTHPWFASSKNVPTSRNTTAGPCKNGIEAYPSYLPNSDYYTRLCTTRHDLKVISGSIASNEALEQTASLLNSIMDYVDPRADVISVQRWLSNFGVPKLGI